MSPRVAALLEAVSVCRKLAEPWRYHTEDPAKDVRAAAAGGRLTAYEHAAETLFQMALKEATPEEREALREAAKQELRKRGKL